LNNLVDAVKLARSRRKSGKQTIIVRKGTCYLPATIVLNSASDDGLTIAG
jgi:hypothetical protein